MASAKAKKLPVLGKTTKADVPADVFGEDFHQSLVHETARADANSRINVAEAGRAASLDTDIHTNTNSAGRLADLGADVCPNVRIRSTGTCRTTCGKRVQESDYF